MLKYFLFLFMLSLSLSGNSQTFITVKGNNLIKDNDPYYFIGTNLWYAVNLASKGAGGDRPRLIRELDHLKKIGVTNLRIMAASEGPATAPGRIQPAMQESPGVYNFDLLEAMDFLLNELAKRDMHAVMCLNNFWPWSGGMAQYVAWSKNNNIPYPPVIGQNEWSTYMKYTATFYTNRKAKKAFRKHIEKVTTRINSINGKAYNNDPVIMAWEIANEPRGIKKARAYRRWIRKTAKYIKRLAPQQLLTIGSEGNTATPAGNHFHKDHKSKYIDYTTIHIWIQNWEWYDPLQPEASFETGLNTAKKYLKDHIQIASQLGKPIVLEEFGIARDLDDHDPAATTIWRDQYYELMFKTLYDAAQNNTPVAGGNFWAWAGEGRPKRAKGVWSVGDDFTGDPPHEYQGWYSVYDKDENTIQIIKKYAQLMSGLGKVTVR